MGEFVLDQIAYVNGAFVPLTEAKVSILDRGFLFADGIYEVSAVLDGKLVDNASHLARLERSVGEIALALPETLARIVEIQINRLEKRLAQQSLQLEVDKSARKLLAAEGYDPQFGARPLKRAIQELLLDPLSIKVLNGEFKPGERIKVTAQDSELVFQKK